MIDVLVHVEDELLQEGDSEKLFTLEHNASHPTNINSVKVKDHLVTLISPTPRIASCPAITPLTLLAVAPNNYTFVPMKTMILMLIKENP